MFIFPYVLIEDLTEATNGELVSLVERLTSKSDIHFFITQYY